MIGIGLDITKLAVGGGETTLIGMAKAANGGAQPLHFFDFIANRAMFNGVDVGTISQVPNLTGTINLVASVGQRVATSANILKITSPGIVYPFSLAATFTRTTDTGAVEAVVQASFGADNLNSARLGVEAADRAVGLLVTAGATQANEIRSGVLAVGTRYKAAARFALNDVITARGGLLSTGDTAAALPSDPDSITIGGAVTATLFLVGDIANVSIFSRALTNAELQAATT